MVSRIAEGSVLYDEEPGFIQSRDGEKIFIRATPWGPLRNLLDLARENRKWLEERARRLSKKV